MKKIIAWLSIILFCTHLLSCNNAKHTNSEKIIGKWLWSKEDRPSYMKKNPIPQYYQNEYDFAENGEYTSTITVFGSSTQTKAKYKIVADSLYCYFSEDVKNPQAPYYYWGKMTFLTDDKLEISRVEHASYLMKKGK